MTDLGGRRVALVTGATSDIGAAVARALASAGCSVALHAHSRPGLAEDIAAELRDSTAGSFTVVSGDVGDIADVEQMNETAAAELGPVGILVNVAAQVRFERFLDSDPEEWQSQIQSTLIGSMNTCRTIGPGMLEGGWGRIVNITAEGALVGEPALAVASIAKAGVLGMTRTLARDLAPGGVTVNCVSPGFVPTSSVPERFLTPERLEAITASYPAGRLGTPEDVASTVAFLCSAEAGYVTGQTLSVSGGYSVR